MAIVDEEAGGSWLGATGRQRGGPRGQGDRPVTGIDLDSTAGEQPAAVTAEGLLFPRSGGLVRT